MRTYEIQHPISYNAMLHADHPVHRYSRSSLWPEQSENAYQFQGGAPKEDMLQSLQYVRDLKSAYIYITHFSTVYFKKKQGL